MIFLWILVIVVLLCVIGHLWTEAASAKELAAHPARGQMVKVHGESMHVLLQGDADAPLAVLLSGWGTPVPSTDFQPLARALHAKGFRTAIVEKFGYGYSDWTKQPRALDTVVDEMREALEKAGVKPPYILCGHSMSGTEMVRWSSRCPEEVKAILSIDAPAPLAYTHLPLPPVAVLRLQTLFRWCGWDRALAHIPAYAKREDGYMNDYRLLTADELALTRIFQKRNTANPCCLREIAVLKESAKTAGGKVNAPVTMCIASDTKEKLLDKLQPEEDNFIRDNKARVVVVRGKHNLQHYDPNVLAEEAARLCGGTEE